MYAARAALAAYGDARDAVLSAATASEMILDDLLGMMLWEEVVRPEDAGLLFDSGLPSRVKREYHPRLGGDWSLDGSGLIAVWHGRLALQRHRVIHAGRAVDRDDAHRALDAADGLTRHIGERLAANARRYPRTAFLFLGERRAKEKDVWSVLESYTLDEGEVPWSTTFGRWRETMRAHTADGRQFTPAPDASRSRLFAVVWPGPRIVWAIGDHVAKQAAVLASAPALPHDTQESVDKAIAARVMAGLEEPESMFVATPQPMSENLLTGWRPAYRVLPLNGVMVNGRDLDPP